MAAPVIVLGEILHDNCITCSDANQFATSLKDEARVFEIECDPLNVTAELNFTKYVIVPANKDLLDFDVGISRDLISPKPGVYSEMAGIKLDKTLYPMDPDQSRVNPRSFCKVTWSKRGCDHHQRCLLACLQSDHRLTIWRLLKKTKKVEQVADISEMLWEIRCKEWSLPKNLSSTEMFREYRRRKFSLAIVDVAWSDIAPSGSVTLLATAQRDGTILIWQLATPLVDKSGITIATMIESGYDWPTALSWLRAGGLENYGDYLAVGSRTGEVGLWFIGQTDSGVTAEKVFDLWDDKDEIPVNYLCWIPSSSISSHIFLLAAKGQHFILHLISSLFPKDARLLGETFEQSPHVSSSSGLSSGSDFALSCCPDGSLVKITPTGDEKEIKMVITVLESHSGFERFYRGCALSSSSVYMALVSCNMHSKKKCFSMNLRAVCDEAGINQSLTNAKVPLHHKADALEWLRCHCIKESDPTVPQLAGLLQWVEHVLPERALYQFQLKRHLEVMQATRSRHAAMKLRRLDEAADTITSLEEKMKSSQEALMRIYLCQTLKKVTKEEYNELNVQMMFYWLSIHQSPSSSPHLQQLTQEALAAVKDIKCVNTDGLHELCYLCKEKIPFMSLWDGSCANEHTWRRCSLTLLLCQTQISRCSFCGTPACVPRETDSPWVRSLLRNPCIFCGGVFLT